MKPRNNSWSWVSLHHLIATMLRIHPTSRDCCLCCRFFVDNNKTFQRAQWAWPTRRWKCVIDDKNNFTKSFHTILLEIRDLKAWQWNNERSQTTNIMRIAFIKNWFYENRWMNSIMKKMFRFRIGLHRNILSTTEIAWETTRSVGAVMLLNPKSLGTHRDLSLLNHARLVDSSLALDAKKSLKMTDDFLWHIYTECHFKS